VKNSIRASKVTVSRLKAGPRQYENERIEVTLDVPPGKTAEDAVAKGRAFIAKQFGETPNEKAVADARAIIAAAEAVTDL